MYLVIGANGYLGSYVIKGILELTKDNIIAVARNTSVVPDFDKSRVEWKSCDITEFAKVDMLCNEVARLDEPVNVVSLAAYHNPELVEKNSRIAWNTNITALAYLLNRLDNIKCLFYPSTDSVYGNSIDSYHYKETDPKNPVNTYGRHKVLAESLVMEYGYNVVRYPFLIGPSLLKHKKHFYDTIVETLKAGKEMDMFADSYRSSLDFAQAGKLLVSLIINYTEEMPKAINICGDDDLSKYDVGLMIADSLGVSKELVIPISVKQQDNGIFTAKRAESSLMDNSVLKNVLNLSQVKINI